MQPFDGWQGLSLWRKSIVAILTLMWLSFSGAIVANLAAPWYLVTPVLGIVWLFFIFVVYLVTRINAY